MCTGHEEAVGPREMARLLSRRGFLRATAGTAAVAGAAGAVGAVGSFASPAAATETGHDHSPAATHRVPVAEMPELIRLLAATLVETPVSTTVAS